jgi:fibronectin-binding autotransporter adhesin
VSSGGTAVNSRGGNLDVQVSGVDDGTLTNSGTVTVANGATLTVNVVTLSNAGAIDVASGTATIEGIVDNTTSGLLLASGNAALIVLTGATISGGTLATSVGGVIETESGGSATIRGATIAASSLVEAISASTLTLSGGTIGAGATVETTSGGTAIVSGTITDSGSLIASGPNSHIAISSGGVVKGSSIQIGNGVVVVSSGGTANVAFLAGDSGGLEIADAAGKATVFTGTVSGFGVNSGGTAHADPAEYIDLVNVQSGASITLHYSSGGSGNTSGTLTVSSGGTLVASIHMLGSYSAGNFQISSGVGGSVEITDPTVFNGGSVTSGPQGFPQNGLDLDSLAFNAHEMTLGYAENTNDIGGTLTVSNGGEAVNISLLGNYMAASFATSPDGHGGTLVTETSATQHPSLAHPHA